MTTHPARTAQEAGQMLAAFRAPHPIDAEYPHGSQEPNYCRTCGVSVYPVKFGFRHDPAEVAILIAQAPSEWAQRAIERRLPAKVTR